MEENEQMVPLTQHNLYPSPQPPRTAGLLRIAMLVIIAFIIVAGGILFWKSARTLTVSGADLEGFAVGTGYRNFVLHKEDTRTDVLLLGMRGENDPNGGLLADTILLASYDTITGDSSLISIPRDLYVDLPGHEKKEKINAIYSVGEGQVPRGGGIALAKQVLSYVIGVYIDNAIAINFDGFTDVVDTVGGITITRDTAFREDQQWRFEGKEGNSYWHIEQNSEGEDGWVFEVPLGTHVLDKETALYYVRSRYTTSDFDRMARQQEVLTAIGDRALSLGVLANPLRVYELLDVIGENVETDMSLALMRSYVDLLRNEVWENAQTHVLDTSPGGLLVSDHQDNQFVLLPRAGHFNDIRDFFQTILYQ